VQHSFNERNEEGEVMSLSRMINKTPVVNEKCNVYELDQINSSLLSQITQSRFFADGVFGIEQYSIGDYMEQYLFSPSFEKYPLPSCDKEWKFDLKEVSVYELVLEKQMFLPLDIKQFVDLFNAIRTIEDASIFTQVLICKRQDNWRGNAISQYESFLKGNENPFMSKFSIKLQEKVLNVMNKISNFVVVRDSIDEIENKILQPNYRFECRFVIFEAKYVDNFVQKVNKNLKKLTFFNEISAKKVKNTKSLLKLVENREFSAEYVNQLLSESELYSLLCSDKPSTVTKVELESTSSTVNKPMSILKQIQNNYLIDAIKLLPFETKKNLTVDKEVANQIQKAFNRVKISKEPLEVTNIERGSRLQKIEIKIPSDKNYSDIKKNVENIRAALGKESLSIEIGDKPESINLYVTCQDTELIYLKQLLESSSFQDYAKDKVLPFVLGEDVIGQPLFTCLSELRHLLICGATGSGKSVFLNCLLICLILYVNPDELILYLVDPKMVELKPYEGFPQVKEVITDMEKASSLLSKLTVEMDRRYEFLSKAGYRDVKGYNKSAENKIPYIVVVVDEYADLVGTNPEVEDYIQRLGQKARGAGVHLVIATQRPSVDILDGAIKSNLPARISFKLESSSDYTTVFGKGIPFEPLGRGDGCARIEGLPKHYQRFQSPIISLDDDVWKDLIINLKKVFKGVVVNDIELPEAEREIDKLKRIIASTNELRVSELQSKMGIAIGKVTDLLKQLLDDGWLRKDGRSYVVNVNDEELNKWKE
jgi:S-DNA-T family DNA segregation ATPase FtsK/SpoIIIE